MIFTYQGKNIYEDVSINYCIHEMFAEKQADSLVIRFNDVKGLWGKWMPKAGDVVTLEEGSGRTGKMFIYSTKPENGLYTVRALSMPLSGKVRRSKSWEGIRFLQLANEIASNHGLAFENFGCKDELYPYITQNNETDFSLFSRICMLEGCQMIIYDGKLIAYNELSIESQPVSGSLEVGIDGNFQYTSGVSNLYGSAEVASGSYSGSFSVSNGSDRTLVPDKAIPVASNAEASRFAKGLLRDANKNVYSGILKRSLMTDYAAASLIRLKTDKASEFDGTVFISKIRYDYVKNSTTFYFRKLLEGGY